jgi:hypothetical protein
MAVVASPWLLPVLALRSTQTAAASVIVAAASAPHLAKSLRATFLSLGSLAGRLAYGLVLLGLGRVDDVETLLRVGGGVGIVSVLVLLGAGAVLPPRIDARAGDPSAAPGRDAAAAAGAPPDGPRKPARPWRSGPRRWR